MSSNSISANEKALREALQKDPSDWETRKRLAHLFYDQGSFEDAAKVVWSAEEIPSIDLELAFAARVLAKAAPRKAIRLLSALLEHNRGKAVQNLGLANALLHHGMVIQAARFYGAAMEADPTLGNPDLEHFILWTDDEETLWGDFKNRQPRLGELPWMKRDPAEALKLTSAISHHTTPIKVASLPPVAGEELTNDLYEQTPERNAQPSPPPAVTIPVDRVAPKDRLFDLELGAPSEPEPPKKKTPRALKQAKPTITKVPDAVAAVPTPSAAAVKKPDLPSLSQPLDEPSNEPSEGLPTPTLPPAGKRPAPARPSLAAPSGLKKLAPAPSLPAKPKLPPLVKKDDGD